jgi:hypothetical protein
MQNARLIPFAFGLFLLLASTAEAGLFCPPRNPPTADLYPGTSGNLRGPVHPSAVNSLRCVVEGLKRTGLAVKTLWGYGCRPGSFSNHPRGLAVDVDQYARDRTNPSVPREQGVEIANSCGVVSGAIWHQADNGHFEVRSLSRAEQAQYVPRHEFQARTTQSLAQQENSPSPWSFFWDFLRRL